MECTRQFLWAEKLHSQTPRLGSFTHKIENTSVEDARMVFNLLFHCDMRRNIANLSDNFCVLVCLISLKLLSLWRTLVPML